MSTARKIAVSLLLFTMLISAGIASASVRLDESNTNSLSTGLVGYWPLDGNTTSWLTDTTQDVSGNGNTGQLIGMSTTTSPVAGKIGQALNFKSASSQYIAVPSSSALSPTNNFSMSAWVKTAVAGAIGAMVDKAGAYAFDIGVTPCTAGQIKVTKYTVVDLCVGTYPSDTKYHYVTAVWSTTGVTVYVDGAVSGTSANTANFATNANPADIGRDVADNVYFNGAIDDVRIYNRALSAQEIQQLYKLGSATVDHSNTTLATGLVGYWPLDGNTTSWKTNTTQDVSGNGNLGRLIAMSTTTSPVPGKIGGALKFNGNTSYVNASAASTYNFDRTNAFSVCAWIYPTNNSVVANAIVSKGTAASPSYTGWTFENFERATTRATSLSFFLISDVNTGNYLEVNAGPNAVVLNQWQYACAAYTGSSVASGVNLYINGVKKTNVVVRDNLSSSITTSEATTIGIRKTGGNTLYPFNGKIDDVRIYNRALSAQEVQQLYKLGTATVAHSNTTLATGLVGYWPFDGNTTSWKTDTTQDVSSNGNTGQLIGMSTSTSPAPGKIGGALKFNGTSSYINVPDAVTLRPGANAFSVSMWAKPSNASVFQKLISKQNVSPSLGWSVAQCGDWWSGTVGKKICFGLNDNGNGNVRSYDTTNNIADGKWHHIVAESDGTALYVYVDGVSQALTVSNNSGSWPNMNQTANLHIGEGPVTENFNGTIDDVRIYNRALSPQEVAQLYAAGR